MHVHDQHLLVVGCARSGTTLLAAMLSCHPEIAILHEDLNLAFRRVLSKKVVGVKLCIPHQVDLSRRSSPLAEALRSIPGLRRSAFVRNWPRARRSIQDLMEHDDRLRVIGVVRRADPTIASITSRGTPPNVAVERWRRSVQVLHGLLQTGTHLSIVSYEALTRNPEWTMRSLLARLGVPFSPEVLQGYMFTPNYLGRTSISPAPESPLEGALFPQPDEIVRQFGELEAAALA